MLLGSGPICTATCRHSVEARLAAAAVEGLHQPMAGCTRSVHVHAWLLLLQGCLRCRSARQWPGRPRLPWQLHTPPAVHAPSAGGSRTQRAPGCIATCTTMCRMLPLHQATCWPVRSQAAGLQAPLPPPRRQAPAAQLLFQSFPAPAVCPQSCSCVLPAAPALLSPTSCCMLGVCPRIRCPPPQGHSKQPSKGSTAAVAAAENSSSRKSSNKRQEEATTSAQRPCGSRPLPLPT